MGNLVLFPAPPNSYDFNLDNLVWIPDYGKSAYFKAKYTTNSSRSALKATSDDTDFRIAECRVCESKMPALFLRCEGGSKHVLLYLHGNSCDLGNISEELRMLHEYLEVDLLAIEFPGYGPTQSQIQRPTATGIDQCVMSAYQWLISLGYPAESVVVFGRSIGTGPAAKLAVMLKNDNVEVGGVILHCPYTSIHRLVADYVTFGTWFVGNHWDTASYLDAISPTTPLCIVHGENDEVIPVYHGKELYYGYRSKLKHKHFPKDSEHNNYRVIEDLGCPIKKFLEEAARNCKGENLFITIPEEYKKAPPEFRSNTSSISNATLQSKYIEESVKSEKSTVSNVPSRQSKNFAMNPVVLEVPVLLNDEQSLKDSSSTSDSFPCLSTVSSHPRAISPPELKLLWPNILSCCSQPADSHTLEYTTSE